MKYKILIELDTETGKWEMVFRNLSGLGSKVEYTEIRPLLEKIFKNFNDELDENMNSDDQIIKHIH